MNKKSKLTVRPGLTLVELMVTTVITIIIVLAIGITLAGSVRGWQTAYGRAFSDVAVESYTARRAFDGIIRKAVRQNFWLSDNGEKLKVKYYSYLSNYLDRYAYFYKDGSKLKLEHGSLDASGNETASGTATVCSSVDSCVFKHGVGRSIEMIITLNDPKKGQSATIVSSAVMHNPG